MLSYPLADPTISTGGVKVVRFYTRSGVELSPSTSTTMEGEMPSWQDIQAIVSLAATVVLAVLTGIYVVYTKRILDSTRRQANLAYSPVIEIEVRKIDIDAANQKNGRRYMRVDLSLANAGNAPAIEVLVDGEVRLRYSQVEGQNTIPSLRPKVRPIINTGSAIVNDMEVWPTFDDPCARAFLDDCRESLHPNNLRQAIKSRHGPPLGPFVGLYVYYRNHLGQYFQSTYEIQSDVMREIPDNDEQVTLTTGRFLIFRPRFHCGPIEKEKMDREIEARNKKRHLAGW